MRPFDAGILEHRSRIRGHDLGRVGRRIVRLVGFSMAAIVERDDPVTRLPQRLEPAGRNPVDLGRGGKAVNEQDRLTIGVPTLIPGDIYITVAHAGRLQAVEIHGVSFSSF